MVQCGTLWYGAVHWFGMVWYDTGNGAGSGYI